MRPATSDSVKGSLMPAVAGTVPRAGLEAHILVAAGDQPQEPLLQPGEEQVLPDDAFEPFHGVAPYRDSLSRMARASSVMSMPTGQQVMQRPQPTRPELPNWST